MGNVCKLKSVDMFQSPSHLTLSSILFSERIEPILGPTCRLFLLPGSVTHQCARPHQSVVKPDISIP